MRLVMGCTVNVTDTKILVADDPPFVRLSIGGTWVQISIEEARHIAVALNQAANRMEMTNAR